MYDAVRQLDKNKNSLVQDKVQTPSEPARIIEDFVNTLTPSYIVAERSTRSRGDIADNYKSVFSRFGDLNIETGTDMTYQHTGWYLGMAFPFALPRAVGGYDPPDQPRWRRPEAKDLPTPRALLHSWLQRYVGLAPRKLPNQHFAMGSAAEVKLFDLTRSLPQRIEAQFRRHWGFVPALWNLYFRDRVNLGASLSIKRGHQLQDLNAETLETLSLIHI